MIKKQRPYFYAAKNNYVIDKCIEDPGSRSGACLAGCIQGPNCRYCGKLLTSDSGCTGLSLLLRQSPGLPLHTFFVLFLVLPSFPKTSQHCVNTPPHFRPIESVCARPSPPSSSTANAHRSVTASPNCARIYSHIYSATTDCITHEKNSSGEHDFRFAPWCLAIAHTTARWTLETIEYRSQYAVMVDAVSLPTPEQGQAIGPEH